MDIWNLNCSSDSRFLHCSVDSMLLHSSVDPCLPNCSVDSKLQCTSKLKYTQSDSTLQYRFQASTSTLQCRFQTPVHFQTLIQIAGIQTVVQILQASIQLYRFWASTLQCRFSLPNDFKLSSNFQSKFQYRQSELRTAVQIKALNIAVQISNLCSLPNLSCILELRRFLLFLFSSLMLLIFYSFMSC